MGKCDDGENSMTKQEIAALVSELNRITVSGEANLDILLGCITFLKSKLHSNAEDGEQNG